MKPIELNGWFSHTGGRKNNEDYAVTCSDQNASLVVVCDGVGGCEGGREASEIVAKCIVESFLGRGTKDPELVLKEAIFQSLDTIKKAVEDEIGHPEMGTTVVAALLAAPTVTLAHVGDSRAFQFRRRLVKRLTADHLTVIESLGIPEPLAKNHPKGHVLSQAIGANHSINPDINTYPVRRGDRLLLCTDGVSDVLDLNIMHSLIRRGSAPECAEQIVRYAIAAGSADNCTAAVAIV